MCFQAKEYHNPAQKKVLYKPPDNPDTNYSYDTAVANQDPKVNPMVNPEIFVTFHPDQALPTYMLVLKKYAAHTCST